MSKRLIDYAAAVICWVGGSAAVLSQSRWTYFNTLWGVIWFVISVVLLVGPFLLLGLVVSTRRLTTPGKAILLLASGLLTCLSVWELLTPEPEGSREPEVAMALFQLLLAFFGYGVAVVAVVIAALVSAPQHSPADECSDDTSPAS
jgi:hypothetical protein